MNMPSLLNDYKVIGSLPIHIVDEFIELMQEQGHIVEKGTSWLSAVSPNPLIRVRWGIPSCGRCPETDLEAARLQGMLEMFNLLSPHRTVDIAPSDPPVG